MGIGSVDNIVINNDVISTEDVHSLLGHMKCPDDWNDLMPNGLGCDYYPNGDPVTVKAVPYFTISDDLKPVLFNLIKGSKCILLSSLLIFFIVIEGLYLSF